MCEGNSRSFRVLLHSASTARTCLTLPPSIQDARPYSSSRWPSPCCVDPPRFPPSTCSIPQPHFEPLVVDCHRCSQGSTFKNGHGCRRNCYWTRRRSRLRDPRQPTGPSRPGLAAPEDSLQSAELTCCYRQSISPLECEEQQHSATMSTSRSKSARPTFVVSFPAFFAVAPAMHARTDSFLGPL